MNKRTCTTLAIIAVGLAVCAGFFLFPRQLTPEECGALYQRYKDAEGIDASFIKDFPVNDTLTTDALLLEAATDSAWCELLLDFGVPEEMIEMYKSNKEFFISNENSSLLLFYMDRNNPSERLPFRHPDSRLVIASFKKQSMSVFLTEDINVKKTIGLSETVKLKNKKQ